MTRHRIVASALTSMFLCSPFFTGCSQEPEYRSIELRPLTSPPADGRFEVTSGDTPSGQILTTVGTAVALSTTPKSKTEDYSSETGVQLSSRDVAIFRILPNTVYPERQFVLWGISPGETCMEVTIDGTMVECISVTVTEAL